MSTYRSLSAGFITLLVLIALLPVCAFADDLDPHYKFSGVKAPDSPYKNTWGAFQTDLFSGSFSYNYKIAVPPGTHGLQPNLALSYNSHAAKGKAGWVGAGWDLPLSYIQRDINYTRKDTSDDKFELYLDGAKHDLVYVAAEGRWHTKNESYLRIEKKTGAPANNTGEYWIVTAKDGTEYRFGYNDDSEKLAETTDTSFARYTWRWSLERIKDSNGNCIFFSYVEDRGSVYLDTITYNNDRKREIKFIREAKPDSYLMIEQGSEVLDSYRVSEIQIRVNGSLVRKYKLGYVMNEIGSKSLLASITQYGSDGVSALPPVRFEYKAMDKGFNEGINWATPGERWIRKTDDDNDTVVDTFDVNGDGLPDLVSYDTDHWDVWLNTKDGFNAANLKWSIPSEWDIRDVEKWIQGQQSPDTRSAPMDLNNDGYIDFLWSDHTNIMQFKLNNNGNGFSATTYSWTLPLPKACVREVVRPDGTNPNVKQDYSDINGDGLPDIVKKENDTSWHIWRNTGGGFVDYGIWPVPHTDAWLEDYTTGDPTELQTGRYDINGDGLVDIVDAHSRPWKIYLNTGSNFLPAQLWNTDFTYINDTSSSGDVKRDLIDLNGDGLPDIVNPVSGVQAWEVYFNTGKGFSAKTSWTVPSEVPQNGYVNNIESLKIGREVLDINGDGLADLVRHVDNVSYWRVYSNRSGQAGLLTKVSDTLGGTIAVGYASSMSYANTRLPFNYWMVSSMNTNNGMTGAHAVSATTNYSYSQGLYDFPNREFRGFGQVTETKADGTKVLHSYYQDEAKKGKEYLTNIRNAADAPYAATTNTFSETAANSIYITNLTRTDESVYDGNPLNQKTVRKEYQNYDLFGNVGLQINYGDLSVAGDEVFTYNEYWAPCSSGTWIADRVRRTYLSATEGGSRLRESFFWYDNSGSCTDKGNLTREERWLDIGSNPAITYQYDSFGNRTQTTDPEGRITRLEYDTVYNTFPEKAFNAKNQLLAKVFNPATGEVLQQTDPNGYSTSYVFDVFGRKIKEIRPYDSLSLPTTSIQYFIDGAAPEYVVVSKREETGGSGTLDTIQSIDGFGALIQTKTEYENPSYMIATDVYYDQLGRVKKQSNPYFTDPAYGYSAANGAVAGVSYSYDAMGRPTQLTNPDATRVSRSFDHWQVTETDENGHAKTYSFDASQRLKQVVENNLGALYTTNYLYSPIGELKQITDHLGNITLLEYDSLGRKKKMTDPDMGVWNYTYDNVGNLKTQTDARGAVTNIQYDQLNRKTLVDYPNSTDLSFTYDANTAGTLAQVTDADGTVNYTYDQRLRKIQEDRTIDSATWTTKWGYDSMDRVVSMTYPNNQTVAFQYNAQGKLENIPGVISGIDYNAVGQITKKNYANNRSTIYTYNPLNNRLSRLAAAGLQDLSYTYDSVGNIKSLVDALTGKTETYSYDDLDRLTQAGDSGYDLRYQYNAIGNMLSLTRDGRTTSYAYGSSTAGPHAVKAITGPYPSVGSFVINNGNLFTNTSIVTLNNISAGSPTQYMASENAGFKGASWKPYSQSPVFLLSAGFGQKTIYFKVRNGDGESASRGDSIDFRLDPADAFIDDDGDGLSNKEEYEHGTNPLLRDTDGDGLSDYTEIKDKKTNPLVRDTDGDGLDDSVDPFPNSPFHKPSSENYRLGEGNFNQGGDRRTSLLFAVRDRLGEPFSRKTFLDTDDDGIPDKDDPDQDNDGMPNEWEQAKGLNPLDSADGQSDADEDGLTNLEEYLHGTNPKLKDSDNDGLDDFQEVKVTHTDPLAPDMDRDGLKDGSDPAPRSIYHYMVSEQYAVRKSSFNAGGFTRSSLSFTTADRLAETSGGVIIPVILYPGISVSPSVMNFGTVVTGEAGIEELIVSNIDMGRLNIQTVSLSGQDADLFSIQSDDCSGSVIPASGSCLIRLAFEPIEGAAKTAIVNITSNDTVHPDLEILLIGMARDTISPETSITEVFPSNSPVNLKTVSISFVSNESEAVFECRLDAGQYGACISTVSYQGLSDGMHIFEVRAIDITGNIDETSAAYSWVIDTAGPEPPIVNLLTNSRNPYPTWEWFQGGGAGAGIYRCQLDGGSWTACMPPYTPLNLLEDGSHVLNVQEQDEAGNWSFSGSRTIVLDTTAPVIAGITTIQTPSTNSYPFYTFSSTETGLITYGGSCTSAINSAVSGNNTITLTGPSGANLTDGTYSDCTISVTDAAGNPSAPLLINTFVVDTTGPTVTINQASSQTDPTNSATINFTAVFSEMVSDFATGDVTIGGTAGATTAVVTGSGTTYNVAVSGMTANATVTVSLAANVAHDAAGNGNTASTSNDNTAIYDGIVPVVQFSSAASNGTESSTPVSFLVTLSTATASNVVTVNYATSDGTATAGSDYAAKTGILTFNPGETSKTISVDITNDTLDEPNETFTLILSDPVNATLGAASAHTYTINDDDDPPVVQFSSATSGGAESVSNAVVTVTLSSASGQTVTVNYATSNGTATAGSDYTTTSDTLTFNPGETSKTISVPIINDTLIETDETLTVTLSAPVNAALGATATHTYTILNDDHYGTFQLSEAAYGVAESGGTVTVTVKRTNGSSGAVSVAYEVTSETATLNADYRKASLPNQALRAFGFGTSSVEGNNNTLEGGNNTVIGIDNGLGGNDSTVGGGDSGSNNVIIGLAGTLSWADGDNADKTIVFEILNDSLNETDETFSVSLTPDSFQATVAAGQDPGAHPLLGTPSTAVVTIMDDDSLPVVEFAAASSGGNESVTSAAITVSLTPASGRTVTVDYATSDGIATAGSDYTTASGTLTFNAGETTKTINVAITNDGLDEPNETFTVTLTDPANATLGTKAVHTYTIMDDDNPLTVTINQASAQSDPTNGAIINFTVVFSAAVSDFGSTDVTIGGTAGATAASVSGSNTTYNVAVSGMTANGTVTGSISAGVAHDAAGNANMASTSNDNTVIYDGSVPASSIISPQSTGFMMIAGLTITGTASDTGAGVSNVEVSTDGGSTWNLATGTASWSYAWNIPADGTYTIRSRATDGAGNVETPAAGVTVTVYKRQPTAVSTNGRQLLVGGNTFRMKGINYSPVPIGEDPTTMAPYGDYFTSAQSGVYDRDLPLISELGASTVRLWNWDNTADHHDFLDKAYNGGVNPIYVIAGYGLNPGRDIDPASQTNEREQIKAEFRDMVATHKNHPAILMWAIGNDLNSPAMYGGVLDNLMSLINEMAAEAHQEEGAGYHPVTTALQDTDLITTIGTYDNSMPDLDIWGANVYRGNTFGTLFNEYKTVSGKPLAILEYGIDAYDNVNADEYENIGLPYQADYVVSLWNEIETNADSCIGGSLMEYSDEWWKGNTGTATGCPDADPNTQSTCGFTDPGQPDSYSNEEWYGLMRIRRGNSPDIMEPRAAYYAFMELWSGQTLTPVISSSPTSLTFGATEAGQTSLSQTVTITNTGTANLKISSVGLSGTNAGDFLQTNNCAGRTLVPNRSCTSQVSFRPTSRNARAANLSIASNDPTRSTLTVALQGTGTDVAAPAGSIAINNGAIGTKTAAVTLNLTATDNSTEALQVCISNTTTCAATAWTAFSTTKSWTLTTGTGTKTVYAWFRDGAGNTSVRYSDTIIVDAAAPTNGTLTATAGAGQIRLSWSGFSDALSGIAGYKVVYASTTAPASCTAGTVLYDGTATTYTHTGLSNQTYGYRVCASDRTGNTSTGATKTAKPTKAESNPPTGSVTINSGAAWIRSRAVNLTLAATDASVPIQMCVSNTTSCTAWAAFAATKSWTLSTGTGTKTVYVKFRDTWGNTSSAYRDTIGIETTVPVNGTLTLTPGSGQIALNWTGFSDAGSGIGSYKVVYSTSSLPAASCTAGTALPGYAGSGTSYIHTGLNSSLTYYYRVCAVDNAGNTSTGATRSVKPGP